MLVILAELRSLKLTSSILAISHLFGNLGRINFFKQGLDKKIIATFVVPSILFSFLGASIVGILSQDILKIILDIFLIIISILFLVRPSLRVPINRNIVIIGGWYFWSDYRLSRNWRCT